VTTKVREDVSCPWCGVLFGAHDRVCRQAMNHEIGLLHTLLRELDSREPDPEIVAMLRRQIKNCRPFK
jgi:hypothetical protein